ncbi:hypothetical protein C8F04DRAFT_605349 [Mycena alexandri]|uniref:G domain-containing protein n=1 Tax=Mycena alexandri TaxID=1745969 RepID=A0AAD6STS4_9AGAR|nr:hypothetical protein C8F04DRAFT_605349 [Mycena alexandri]
MTLRIRSFKYLHSRRTAGGRNLALTPGASNLEVESRMDLNPPICAGCGVKRRMHSHGYARTLPGLLAFACLPSPGNHDTHVNSFVHTQHVLTSDTLQSQHTSRVSYHVAHAPFRQAFVQNYTTACPAFAPSRLCVSAELMSDIIASRADYPRFRILIVGRTNAGKSTLVKRICNSSENPRVLTARGEMVDMTDGAFERVPPDIENQLVFRSNPRMIFHVSCGFESGSGEEMDKVKDFIAKHAASSFPAERLHVIWYCMPTDTNRPFLKAEEKFFNNDIAGKVPVLMVFTKLDALGTQAFVHLMRQGVDLKRAREGTAAMAHQILATHFQEPLETTKSPPTDYVRLDDLRKDDADCTELVQRTAKALTSDAVRLLFVSSQQHSLDVCIQHAVAAFIKSHLKTAPPSRKSWLQKLMGNLTKSLKASKELRELVRDTLAYLPQAWASKRAFDPFRISSSC